MRKGLLLIFSLILFGCSKAPSVHVQYYVESKDERASLFVGSPDPEKNAPLEEKFLIRWHVQEKPLYTEHLELEVMYGDMTIEKIKKPITQNYGVWIYRLSKEHIISKSGILTYQVLLIDKNKIVTQWDDLLWFSLITKKT